MYRRYAEYLYEMASAKESNYMSFFPSYHFLEQVYDAFVELVGRKQSASEGREEYNVGQIECLVQAPYMSEEAREIFLEGFEEEREGSLMGFCVMGGVFSEEIDLAKERLIGAVIVGTGLPQVCLERELLKNYFDARGQNGFDYAYVYPGMNKVQQSAGRERVIRLKREQKCDSLLDERFREARYRNTFPREWKGIQYCNIHNVRDQIQSFWSGSSVNKLRTLSQPEIRKFIVVNNSKFSLWQGFSGFYNKEFIGIIRYTVVRNKGNAWSIREGRSQVVAAEFCFRNQFQLVLLKETVQRIACGTFACPASEADTQRVLQESFRSFNHEKDWLATNTSRNCLIRLIDQRFRCYLDSLRR